jgi:hypothetical protein
MSTTTGLDIAIDSVIVNDVHSGHRYRAWPMPMDMISSTIISQGEFKYTSFLSEEPAEHRIHLTEDTPLSQISVWNNLSPASILFVTFMNRIEVCAAPAFTDHGADYILIYRYEVPLTLSRGHYYNDDDNDTDAADLSHTLFAPCPCLRLGPYYQRFKTWCLRLVGAR